jgi:hypothetical protein
MYFYSLSLFGLICFLTPQIRNRSPLPALSFAYLYLLDSLINISYTVLFAISWFFVLSSNHRVALPSAGKKMDEASQITSTSFNVSLVNVVSTPPDTFIGGQEAIAVGSPEDAMVSGVAGGMLQPESATSIFIIAIFWAIRLYCIVVVFAWARQVVWSSVTPAEEPFEGRNGGFGWRGRLGRSLISIGKGYWRGEGWALLGGNTLRGSTPGDWVRFRRDRMSVDRYIIFDNENDREGLVSNTYSSQAVEDRSLLCY